MPITIVLKDLLLAKPALDRLTAMKFPMTTSYRLSKRLRLATAEIADYEKKHDEIVTELGLPIEGMPDKIGIAQLILDPEALAADPSSKKTITNPKWTEYQKRLAELRAVTVTLEIEPIKIEELAPLTTVKVCCPKCKELITDDNAQGMTLDDMIALSPLLTDDGGEKPAAPPKLTSV
jgi:hypothetical protein